MVEIQDAAAAREEGDKTEHVEEIEPPLLDLMRSVGLAAAQ